MTEADRIEAEAARWIARRDAGPLTEAENRALDAWCAGDPRRLGALVRLEAVNARIERAQALQGLPIPPHGFGWRRAIAAAVAVVLLGLASVWQLGLFAPAAIDRRELATRVGEQYRAQLVDGSTVELNTASKASVELRPDVREVRLSSGEALFEVAKDKARPFIVKTALGDVRAVGTMFSVRVDDGLDVTVSEGIVSIERGDGAVVRLAAGERFALSASGDAIRAARPPEEIQRAFAWREGKLAFAGETLAEAAATFNRYNRLRIEVVGKARTMRFGGYYRASDPEGFVAALGESLPIEMRRDGTTLIVTEREDR